MTVLYQLLSVIINLFAVLIGIAALYMLPLSLVAPAMWLPTFVMAAIVLYTWFGGRFRTRVLLRQEVVRLSLRDWIRVNGFVAIAFSILNIPGTLAVLMNPARFADAMKETLKGFGEKYEQSFRPEYLGTLSTIMFIYFVALLVHVLWTFSLMKKHREFFK